METLTTEQLKNTKDSNEDFLLINVLKPEHFEKAHIPGSENIPVGSDDFVQQVEQRAGNKDRKIVVYCANTECDASPAAAKMLDQAGFKNIYDYEGGVKEWQRADLPVESLV